MARVLVVGQVGRDLVLQLDELPAAGGSSPVTGRQELVGGKGTNQAVALSQLGVQTALAGVVGDDDVGSGLLAQLERDGIDVSRVRSRAGAMTALFVDIVEPGGARRVLEDVPAAVLLSPDDPVAVTSFDAVLLQLQQPSAALVPLARTASAAGSLVALDGAPTDMDDADALLHAADVVRMDAAEAQIWAGHDLADAAEVEDFARTLTRCGPGVVAIEAGQQGNVVAWCRRDHGEGSLLIPLDDSEPVVDPTGGGDAFAAVLVAALIGGRPPEQAARAASRAAGHTASSAGGRPALTGFDW